MKITTITELDALPDRSVVLDGSDDPEAWQKYSTGWWVAGMNEPAPAKDLLRYGTPATVLHIPGRNLVQEAQANARDEGYALGVNDERTAAAVDIGVGPNRTNPYRNEAP